MSVHRVANGWAVRWRDAGRNRRRTFDRKSDAVRYDAEVRRRKQLGTLADLDAPATTLNEYVRATWAPTYAPLLAPRTREVYAQTYGRHVGPRLGEHQLRSITPAVVSGWQSGLLRGGVGHPTIAKARAVLSAILQTAVEAGPIPTNPVRSVRAPRAPLAEEVRPLAPATVEAIRAVLPLRDATMVSVLAYAGLRPGELRELRWGNVGERTLVVNASKNGRRRSVRLLAPLARDLREWRLAAGRPDPGAPVFPRPSDGEAMSPRSFNQWRGDVFAPALRRAGVDPARPYDLRHSFASLLLYEGRSAIYVARQLGHGAVLTLRTYGHVIDELEDAPRVSAEDAIRAARAEDVPRVFLG